MQTTLLPVDRLLSLHGAVADKVKFPHATYNMGLRPHADGGYVGVFRNGTRNARHLLGWPAMAENKYEHLLYQIILNKRFEPQIIQPMPTDRIVHDVRLSNLGAIGCEKVDETTYYPIQLHTRPTGGAICQRIYHKPGKNWNLLPDGWFDCGWLDHAGLARMKGCIPMIVEDGKIQLRGSAPSFWLHDRLITTYHDVQFDEAGKRNYFHYFAELIPRPPFDLLRISPPFKLGRGGDPGRIQFLMACFPMPKDPQHFIVSYGEADADNCVGRIKTADILGLLL